MNTDPHAVETLFPELTCSGDVVIAQVIRSARRVTLPPGASVFRQGSACEQYLLVIDGSVRVLMLTDAGHEVVLYHVRPGESCMLTTSCLLGHVPYPADGVTETSVSALAIESGEFRRALGESPGFRTFVFRNLGERFAEVVGRLSESPSAPSTGAWRRHCCGAISQANPLHSRIKHSQWNSALPVKWSRGT